MKAVLIKNFGGPEMLTVQEVNKPVIKADEILIQVKAAGVNRPDVLQRQGKYPAPEGINQHIPGLEVAGEIVELGLNVKNLNIGDRVMALVAGEGYAQYVKVHFGSVIPLPDLLSFEEGAALPETVFTVWHNLFQRANLSSGQSVLIHGGAGGIGSTAIQLAKLFGAYVITTVSSEEKEEYVKAQGADVVINYKHIDFEKSLQATPVDVVLDFIGGEYFNKNINILKEDGHLVYLNAMQGNKVELNLLKMMQKRLTITGSTLRNRSVEFKTYLTSDIVKKVLPLITQGKLKPSIYKKIGFQQAYEAHEMMEKGEVLGKIVLLF